MKDYALKDEILSWLAGSPYLTNYDLYESLKVDSNKVDEFITIIQHDGYIIFKRLGEREPGEMLSMSRDGIITEEGRAFLYQGGYTKLYNIEKSINRKDFLWRFVTIIVALISLTASSLTGILQYNANIRANLLEFKNLRLQGQIDSIIKAKPVQVAIKTDTIKPVNKMKKK